MTNSKERFLGRLLEELNDRLWRKMEAISIWKDLRNSPKSDTGRQRVYEFTA